MTCEECFIFSATHGSTVDTFLYVSLRWPLRVFTVFPRESGTLDPEVDSRRVHGECPGFVFGALYIRYRAGSNVHRDMAPRIWRTCAVAMTNTSSVTSNQNHNHHNHHNHVAILAQAHEVHGTSKSV